MPVAAVGRKDDALAAALRGEPSGVAETPPVGYYVGKRPLRLGKEVLAPGDEIPEAARFPRLEAWLRSGMVVEGPPNTIEAEEFRAVAPVEPQFRSGFPEKAKAK